MDWKIPAKTFLLGEYAAIEGGSAIVLTTAPLFKLTLIEKEKSIPAWHPNSPAGKLWADLGNNSHVLLWGDPYQGLGGLGASSAQFIGAYLAHCYLFGKEANTQALLELYYHYAWEGEGHRPSGYDILAQTLNQCVYINLQKKCIECFTWPFKDISFLLLRSGEKLATHQHLLNLTFTGNVSELSAIVDQARRAFETEDSSLLIHSINAYQQQLSLLNLTAKHSLEKMASLKANKDLLAIKGCGAMGADVLLLIFPQENIHQQIKVLSAEGWTILASDKTLHSEEGLLKKISIKT